MGNLLACPLGYFSPTTPAQPMRLLLLGLDASGKTTILYKLKRGGGSTVDTAIPTIGFNIETLNLQGTMWTAFDVGGRSKIRSIWRHYYQDTDALVFVVDSNDIHRLEHARDELHRTLAEELLAGIPLLLLCNKQDLPNALPPKEITKILEINGEEMQRELLSLGCSATRGEGLYEGLAWLHKTLQQHKTKVPPDDDSADHSNPSDNKLDTTPPPSPKSDMNKLASHLGYDPTDASNLTLEHFRPIHRGTECPFAKSAKLWGGKFITTTGGQTSIEAQAKASAPALTEFVRRSNAGESLDGFCFELDDESARKGGPEELGRCVLRLLTSLSNVDSSGEAMLRVNYIGARGWRFRFNKADFFVTTFAPCYPSTSSRYAFGTGRAFLLLQPELSFARHNLPMDTPATSDPPKTVRDKTRLAFRDAGRSYYIPDTTKYPPAEHIVKPLHDDGVTVVRWWEQDDLGESKSEVP